MVCANDWPGGVCSGNGYCDSVTDQVSASARDGSSLACGGTVTYTHFGCVWRQCVCDPGYDGLGDLVFRPADGGLGVSDCQINRKVMDGLWVVAAVACALCVCSIVINISRRVWNMPSRDREMFKTSMALSLLDRES
jgi:hypothetical protein